MQRSLNSTGVRRQVVEEPRLGPNRDSLGEETGGESVRERTELMFKLINIQGLSEEKLRELEDRFFGDVRDEKVKHVILCLTETQQKMKKFRERPDLVTFVQQREEGDKRGGEGVAHSNEQDPRDQVQESYG